MEITLKQLISISPLIITGWTVVILMSSIAWRRNHFINATFSILGLNFALLSLWCVKQIGEIEISPLIYIDNCSMLHTGLILLGSQVTCALAYLWLKEYDRNKEEFYLLVTITALGGIVLVNANHFLTLFLGIELCSLPLFGLIGYISHRKYSLEASTKYMILSAVASSFLLFGMTLLYAQIGNLSFLEISKYCSNGNTIKPLLLIGITFIIASLSFKLSLVPFHLWTPDVYQGAPALVSGFLSTIGKISVFCILIRLLVHNHIGNIEVIRILLSTIAFFSIIFGNLMAMNQISIKRLLSYSSISHIGYLLVALIALQQYEQIMQESITIYLINYLFSNLGVFGVISLLSSPYRGEKDVEWIFAYRGLFWHHPILSIIITIMMLSLAGIPMTLGFIGKFYILTASIQAQLWWLIIAMTIGSIIGFYYYMRVIVNLYLKKSYQLNSNILFPLRKWQCSFSGMLILVFTILILILGIYPQPLITILQNAIISCYN